MTGLRPALIGLGLLGVLLAAFAVSLMFNSTTASEGEKTANAILLAGAMLSYIATGLLAWWRRPNNRVGALMTAVGFTIFLDALTESDIPWVFTLGCLGGALFYIVSIHLVLAYPTGRIADRAERWALTVAYVLAVGAPFLFALVSRDLEPANEPTPSNPLLITDQPGIADTIDIATNALGVVVVGVMVALIIRRWRRATRPARRLLTPILFCGGLMVVLLAVLLATITVSGEDSGPTNVVGLAALIPYILLPYVFLAGLLRSRWARAGAVGDLVERLGGERASLQRAVADALGDPTIELAYWLESDERFVSEDGHPVVLPADDDAQRAAALVRHGDELVGAIVHDASLDEEPELVSAAAGAAALAMQNGRLEAELRAKVADLQDSRARIVTAGMDERRRLERDLHDGAQQRLVALSLQIGLARNAIDRDADDARALLSRASIELDQALEELRELARGIHPAILTDRGLTAAVEALAARSPTPVEVEAMPEERLPAPVEAAAYFVVSEALANLAKHAAAQHATVRVQRQNGHAVVEVTDDGRGGADPAGHGLRGLADRVDALDGRLAVQSPPGAGTFIRAEIPCASS